MLTIKMACKAHLRSVKAPLGISKRKRLRVTRVCQKIRIFTTKVCVKLGILLPAPLHVHFNWSGGYYLLFNYVSSLFATRNLIFIHTGIYSCCCFSINRVKSVMKE